MTPRSNAKELNQASGDLLLLVIELQSLAYLIGMQRFDEIPRPDIEEINWGIGQMLERIAIKLKAFISDPNDSK